MLNSKRIQELANRSGVKKIAVENFLMSVSANASVYEALANLHCDAKSYKWNAKTVSAIRTGIEEHFQRSH